MPRYKILFILKRREDYNSVVHSAHGLSTGLFNSAGYVVKMLQKNGITANLEIAVDNNCIDRLVTKHRPTHVVIEALWVVPSKFHILSKLHPKVKWIVRLHSEMPFLAGEGIAMNWLGEYIEHPKITIGVNAPRMLNEVRTYLGMKVTNVHKRVIYLPNYYPQEYETKKFNPHKVINVGCFGAIRPLKNQLLQAIAALKFADKLMMHLHFHINLGRVEMKGDPVKHNLEGLFKQIEFSGHKLVKHEWTPREEFLELCRKMDIGMQCNFSETFNIVSADLVSVGVPIVGSKEIPWSSKWFNADPTDSEDMSNKLIRSFQLPQINVGLNQYNLTKYTDLSECIWLEYLPKHKF